jgi:hypothetical protein
MPRFSKCRRKDFATVVLHICGDFVLWCPLNMKKVPGKLGEQGFHWQHMFCQSLAVLFKDI